MSLNNEKGFTLIEMMIVLLIISVLLLIAVPNMTKSNTIVGETTCEATRDLLQSQVAAYEMETGTELTSLNDLVTQGYVDQIKCPSGKSLEFVDGEVQITDS